MTSGLKLLAELAAGQPLSPACDHFYFLRHGQTACNARRIFQAVDEPLSELGVQQAHHAASILAGEPVRSILTSGVVRALTTAHTVSAPHGIAPLVLEGLRERNFGALIGTSSASIDWACEPENGETLPEFIDRSRAAIEHALAHPGPVLIVAHGGTLYVLAALLGVPVDLGVLGNAQPLRFEQSGTTWRLKPLLQQVDGGAALA
ncbi:probable phosphoglycerate mutase [Variovorax sp. HW608]|uniref:histidine phosphatase family protein n=1 Tax=Variovorax sp. HW608 TaxID=1034889 RepID=UPI00081F88AF|nr:histidine phosphatase family protein [Variovorax sp. HW608]SCK51301.1 probable phosphoglycerate mutase [Variovorax sp. HW608]